MARIDTFSAQLALRQRLLTLSVATTGSTTLGQSALGFTRTSGSFISDSFYPGMEVTPDGFPSSTRYVVTDVSALLMRVRGTITATTAASGRTLTAALPATRGFENRRLETTVDVVPYIEEEYVPRPPVRLTTPANGSVVQELGLWVIRWFGLQGYDVGGLRRSTDAVLALFTPGTTMTAGAHTVRVQGGPTEPAPFAGQFLRSGDHMVSTISIPVEAYTTNVIAP